MRFIKWFLISAALFSAIAGIAVLLTKAMIWLERRLKWSIVTAYIVVIIVALSLGVGLVSLIPTTTTR